MRRGEPELKVCEKAAAGKFGQITGQCGNDRRDLASRQRSTSSGSTAESATRDSGLEHEHEDCDHDTAWYKRLLDELLRWLEPCRLRHLDKKLSTSSAMRDVVIGAKKIVNGR